MIVKQIVTGGVSVAGGVAGAVAIAALSLSALATNRPLTETELASPGAQAISKLPREFINAPKAKRFSLRAKQDDDIAAGREIEEIRVIGERDPEDAVAAKRPPSLVFRNQLERDKTLSAKDITMMGLCFIGLCGSNYGPDGAPVEDKTFTRAELKKDKSSLDMSKQFAGTYQ